MSQLLVVGIGNESRKDDGAGLEVARRIEAFCYPGVEVRLLSGEGAALMESWKGFDRVVLVDATSSGNPPGTVHTFDLRKTRIPLDMMPHSSHQFGVAEAVELARELDRLPPEITFYGIEGRDFGQGFGLSEEITASVEDVIHSVVCSESP